MCSDSEDMESKLMVDDVYDILSALSAATDGRIAMCADHTVSALCQAVANRCYRMFTVSLACLIAYCKLFGSTAMCNDSTEKVVKTFHASVARDSMFLVCSCISLCMDWMCVYLNHC